LIINAAGDESRPPFLLEFTSSAMFQNHPAFSLKTWNTDDELGLRWQSEAPTPLFRARTDHRGSPVIRKRRRHSVLPAQSI
jgi:hypothetical protein